MRPDPAQPLHYAPPGARGVELRDRPTISVVVAWQGPLQRLQDLLASLTWGESADRPEIVVVRAGNREDAALLAQAHPDVRFVEAPEDDVRTLRVMGVTHATGAVVHIVSDGSDARLEAALRAAFLPASAPADSAGRPALSVIVPAHQSERVLDASLGALGASDLPRDVWELVVVDDASTDRTELVAAVYADVIVRLAGNPHGPAYARNRGAEASGGAVLVFVDADVTVHANAMGLILAHFTGSEQPDAVFGSYDATPFSGGLPSQYRNLLHHYVHVRHAGPAETFWSGLGAVRACVFRDVGMFDEWHYSRPQIEDIELGRRLRNARYRILLDPAIQGTHLKHWTLWNILATDFRHRGVPWMWLILHEGRAPESHRLNVGRVEQICTALMALALLAASVAMFRWQTWPLVVAGASVGVVTAINLPFYWYLRRHRSLLFSIAVFPLHLTYYVVNVLAAGAGWLVYQFLGAPAPPPASQTAAQLGLRSWPPPITRPAQSTWASRRSPIGHRNGKSA